MKKMRIKLINPNTTWSMTEKIGSCARAVVAPTTDVIAVSPTMGPVSIESHYDEALAAVGLLDEIRRGEGEGIDGYVVACFGDPGLKAAREIARGPVVGIAEAAMHMASMLGSRFTVVTTLSRTIGQAWHLAQTYGMQLSCANVRACELPVLALEEAKVDTKRIIEAECRRALQEDDADVIVLGCAGMADLCDEISQSFGVPVIDGVTAATKMVESLIQLGLRTSKRNEFATPRPKPVTGLLEGLSLTP